MAKAAKKTAKKQQEKPLQVKGSFLEIMTAAAKNADKKSADKKKKPDTSFRIIDTGRQGG